MFKDSRKIVSEVSRPHSAAITPEDSLTIGEFSSLFGFPAEALMEAIRRNRTSLKKSFYSIPDLAARWDCSRGTVYNILAESEFKVLNLTRKGKDKGKRLVPAAVIEKLEQSRMRPVERAS